MVIVETFLEFCGFQQLAQRVLRFTSLLKGGDKTDLPPTGH
jgi:hypothetical protein